MTPRAAMIFAAGFGTRLAERSGSLPKPLVKIGGRPMVDYAIDLLRSAGIQRIVANTHHRHDLIGPYLESQGVIVSHEVGRILDTGGGLRAALPLLDDGPVLTFNPDALWFGENPVSDLLLAWEPSMQALLSLVPMEQTLASGDEGDFSLEHGEIRRKGPFRYGGAQIIQTARLGEIPDDAFSLNAYWDLMAQDGPLNGLIYGGEWCDIGHPEGLDMGEKLLANV